MKFSALKKASACRVNRENSVSVHKGDGEFAIYQEMSNRIKAYKESLTETIDEAVEKLKEWLENDFETTSKWQKKDASKKAIAKVERYLKACPEKSLPTRYLNFSFAGETYTGFRPDFVFLSEIPTPIVLRDMKVEKLPMLHLVKFSASKQKVGNGTGRALESTVSTHPFTLGAIFYAQRFFEERAVSSFYVVKVSFDALVSEQDNKDYKEFGHYFDYSENEASKDARVSTYFVFNGKRLIRWGNSLNSSFSLSAHRNFFPKMIELIKGIQESEKCTQADCEKCILYNRCHYTEPPLALPEKAERTITVEDIKLSEEQERIVNAKTGIFRVLATAGSGKTFCMVLRIIKLIEDGVDPTAMLLISFSNIAVEELRSRIEKMLKVYGYDEFVDVNDFTIVTFNSLGSQLISEYFEMLGFEKKPELIDNIEQYDIVNEVVKESEEKIVGLDYENPYLKFGSNTVGIIAKLSNLFDEIKREKIETFADYDKYLGLTDKIRHCSAGAETVAAQEKREKYRQIFKEFEKYSEKLKNADIVDYADQSIYVDELIRRSFEDGIDYIIDAFEFEHIVVDEFQDSNEFQLRFVKALMGHMKFKSLMVVGDDSQAIYGFNHTSPENIIHFDKKLGMKVTDLELSETRRFGQDICDIANSILAPNTEKVEKQIHSSQPLSVFKPRLIGFDSKTTEYDTIALECKKLIDSGVNPEDIIFLSTRNDDFSAMMKSMNKAGVPALKLSEKFTANSRVISIIALSKFVLDFDDTASLMDYLNEAYGNTFFDYEPEDVEAIIEREKEQFTKLFIPMTDEEKISFFLSLIQKIDISCDLTAQEFVKKVLDKAKSYRSVYSLAAYIVKYEKYQSEDEAKLTGKYPAVTLSTVWKAKGGEWDYVFCSLSSVDSTRGFNKAEIEEKRRLIFTMVTRMKKGLTVTSVKNLTRKTKLAEEEIIPNRFYGELKELEGFEKSEVADVKKTTKKKTAKKTESEEKSEEEVMKYAAS